MTDITDVFRQFDTENTGRFPLTRIGAAIRSTGIAITEKELVQVTAGMSSTVDLKEFTSAVGRASSLPRPQADELASLAAAQFPTSSSSAVNITELRHALENIGDTLTEEEVDELLQHVELDKSGNILMTSLAAALKPNQ